MTSNLMENAYSKIFDNIYFNKNNILSNNYELVNLNLLDSLLKDDNKNHYLIHPGGNVVNAVYLLTLAFQSYLKNMKDPENNIMEILCIDDIVLYKGNRVRYKGIVNINSEEMIALEHRNKGDKTYILKKNAYQLSVYNGDASTLTTMSSKKRKKKDISNQVLSQLLDINENELNGVINYSSVVVMPNVFEIEYLVNNIKIKINDKKYDFPNIFPCGYWTSADSYRDYPGNIAKKKHLIKFTTKISTARDLVQSDKSIKNLIIIDYFNYKNCIAEVDILIKRRSLNKLIVINDWNNVRMFREFYDYKDEMKVHALGKKFILDKIDLYGFKETELRNRATEQQYDLINNFLRKQTLVRSCKIDKYIVDVLKRCRFNIKKLSNQENSANIDKYNFSNNSGKLLNILENSLVPINYLESKVDEYKLNISKPTDIIENLKETAEIFRLYKSDYITMQDIIEYLTIVKKYFSDSNPKYDYLVKYIQKNKMRKMAILLRNNNEAYILKKLLVEKNININVCAINKFKFHDILDEIILNGISYNDKFDVFNDNFCLLTSNLIYEHQERIYEYLLKENKKLLRTIDNLNMLNVNEVIDWNDLESIEENEGNKEILEEIALVEEKTFEINIMDLINRSICFANKGYDNTSQTINTYKTIIFTNNEFALLSKMYKANVINFTEGIILEKDIEEIAVGDELIFIKDNGEGNKYLIIDIIEKLLTNKTFNREFGQAFYYSKYWKEAIRDYLNNNNITIRQFGEKVELYDPNINYGRISGWLFNDYIIGPREKEVYYALSLVLDDEVFRSEWQKIFDSCNIIRNLHTRIKKAFAKIIIKTLINNDEKLNEIEKLILSSIGNVHEYIEIVEVERIVSEEREVAINIVNRLINS